MLSVHLSLSAKRLPKRGNLYLMTEAAQWRRLGSTREKSTDWSSKCCCASSNTSSPFCYRILFCKAEDANCYFGESCGIDGEGEEVLVTWPGVYVFLSSPRKNERMDPIQFWATNAKLLLAYYPEQVITSCLDNDSVEQFPPLPSYTKYIY